MLRWYLVHTKQSGETNAQLHLTRQGYSVYFPRMVRLARWGGRLRERIVALFPRYLFVQLDEGQQALSPVHSTVGVSNVVRFGSSYATVPDGIVEEVRSRADPDSGLHRMRAQPLSRGCTVRIAAGPFEGLEAVFECGAGAERVMVLLKILGQETLVRIPAGSVLPGMAV